MDGFEVDVPALRHVGVEAGEAGEALRQAMNAARGALGVVDSSGWSASPVSQQANDTWAADLDRLSAAVTTLGADLTSAADG
ncbi:hypothetical protein, partial [Mangrovihabitans endophyticus]|uniref:hypothetical protein n=1 Tax=Mangrovihabitans endophyticus TaxID=1751298 RepID=UPI00166BAF5C